RARLARLLAELRVVLLHPLLDVAVERRIVGRDAVVRRALEHVQVPRLPGDDRDRLNGRGAGADDADALASEVHALVRPAAGVIPGALEVLEPGELRHLRAGQTAGGHDAEARGEAIAAVGLDRPAPRGLLEDRGGHARRALDVAAKVEAIGHVVDVRQD